MPKGGKKLKNTTEKPAKSKPKKINLKVRQINSGQGVKKQALPKREEIVSKKKQREIVAEEIRQAENKGEPKKKKSFFKKKSRPEAVNLLGNNQKERSKEGAGKGAKIKRRRIKDKARAGLEQKKKKIKLRGKNQKLNNNFEIDQERLEKDKRLIMISGVVFFMVLISFFWFYNFKHNLEKNSRQSAANLSSSDWEDFTKNINKNLEEMKSGLEQIKTFSDSATSTASTSPARLPENKEAIPASSTEPSTEKINLLKNKLEEMRK